MANNKDFRVKNNLFVKGLGTSTFSGDVSVGDTITVQGAATFQDDVAFNGAFNPTSINASGNVVIGGNLTVNGTTTTVDTNNLNVKDKNITLNYSTGDSSALANGAGITIQDAVNSTTDATILWDSTTDRFDFSHDIQLPDGAKFIAGDSADINIRHSTNSFIENYTGTLRIINYSDDQDIKFESDDGSGGVTEYFMLDGSQAQSRFLKDAKWNDSVKAKFGTDEDLQIYHDGTHSYMDSSTGSLYIRTGNTLQFKNQSGSETLATFAVNGASTLYHDNSAKLATTSSGVDVTGAVNATTNVDAPIFQINNTNFANESANGAYHQIRDPDARTAIFLGGSDEGNYYDNSTHYFRNRSSNNYAFLNANGFYLSQGGYRVGTTTVITASRNLTNIGTGSFSGTVSIDQGASFSKLQIGTGRTGATENIGAVEFLNSSNALKAQVYGSNDGKLRLTTNGSTVALTLDASQNATFAGDISLPDVKKIKLGSDNDLLLYHDSGSVIEDVGTNGLEIRTNGPDIRMIGGSNELMAKFVKDGAVELYHDNVKRLETTSSGVSMTNGLVVEGASTFNDDVAFSAGITSNLSVSGAITSTALSIESATANLTLKDTSDDDDHQIYFKDNGGTVRYQITSAGDQFNFATNGSREIVFLPSDTEKFRIGTAYNESKQQIRIVTSDGSGSSGGIYFRESGQQIHRIYPDNQYQYNTIGSSTPEWIWKQEGGSNNAVLNDNGLYLHQGTYRIGSITVIDASRNLTNIVNITTTGTGIIGGGLDVGTFTSTGTTSLNLKAEAQHDTKLGLFEDNANYGFSLNYDGGTNQFALKRHDNSASGASVLTFTRTDNNATFAGTVTATAFTGDGSGLTNLPTVTVNNNADNRIITGSGTANTLNAQSLLTFGNSTGSGSNSSLEISGGSTHPPVLSLLNTTGSSTTDYATIAHDGANAVITSRNGSSKGGIKFEGITTTTPTTYGGFDADGNFEIGSTNVISSARHLHNIVNVTTSGQTILGSGTTNAQTSDKLYIGGTDLNSADAAIYFGNNGDGSGVGWRFFYEGSGSGNLNKLIIRSENLGSPVNALAFTQDGNATFAGTITSGAITSSGTITSSNGTVTNVMSFSDRGIFGTTSNHPVEIRTNGTEAIRIATDNKVGINETSPASLLHITGTAGSWDRHITIEYDANDIGKILVDTDGIKFRNMSSGNGFYFRDSSNATQMLINSSGNVGIAVGSNPATRLDVGGNIGISGTEVITASRNLTNIGTISAGVFTTNANTGTFSNSIGTLPLVTSTPYDYVAKFESTDATAQIILEDVNGNNNANRIGVTTHDMFFVVNNTEAIRIENDGKVGIGTQTPSARLHVQGSGATVTSLVECTDGNQASLDLKNSEGHYRIITNSGQLQIYDQTDSRQPFTIDTGGTSTFDRVIDNNKKGRYTSISGSSGDWFPIMNITDSTNGPVIVCMNTYAHSKVTFTASRGYTPSNSASLTILTTNYNPNVTYANVAGLRIKSNGLVEAKLVWSSGPNVDIDIYTIDANQGVISYPASLATTTDTNNVQDSHEWTETGVTSARKLNALSSYLLGSTEIVDSSKNLTNIGSYSGSGNITLNSGSNQISLAVTNGSIELTRTGGGPFIDFKNSTSDDFDARIINSSNGLSFLTGGQGSSVNALVLDSARNATFSSFVDIPSKLRHSGDTDTCLNFTTDTITLETAGAARVAIDSSGLAIGNGSILTRIRSLSSSGFTDTVIENFSSGAYRERLRINSSGSFLAGITSQVGIGGTPADENSFELGRGYLNLARDDTASAKQITFGKNGAVHSYIETTSSGLSLGLDANNLITVSSSNQVFRVEGSNIVTFESDGVTIAGDLSKSSGSFKIDHPLKPDTHHLVHSFVEGPQADNLYRGTITLQDGRAVIDLDEWFGMTPGTFLALNRDIQAFVSNIDDWDAVRAKMMGSQLLIECQNAESKASVSWLVVGERQDKEIYASKLTDDNGKIIVEPSKEVVE